MATKEKAMAKDVDRTVKVCRDKKGAAFKIALKRSSDYDERFLWDEIVTVKWGTKSIDFYVFARTDHDDQKQSKAWGHALTQIAAKTLKKGALSAFVRNDLTDYMQEEYEEVNSIELKLSKKAFEKLETEQEYDDRARRSFRYVVKRLYRLAYGPSEKSHSEAVGLLVFLENSLECAHLGPMYSWSHEKLGSITRYFSTFLNQKQRSNKAFKTQQDDATANLSCFSEPLAWTGKPNAFDEDFLRKNAAAEPEPFPA